MIPRTCRRAAAIVTVIVAIRAPDAGVGMTTETDASVGRSGLESPERVFTALVSVTLLLVGLGVLGSTVMDVLVTASSTCELEVTVPVSAEVVVEETSVAVSGAYSTARFVMCNPDPSGRAGLAASRLLDAVVVTALLFPVSIVGYRAARDRPLFSGLIVATAVAGATMVVLPVLSQTLEQAATVTLAKQLRGAGLETVAPDAVWVPVDVRAVMVGVALLLLATLLRVFRRSARDTVGLT